MRHAQETSTTDTVTPDADAVSGATSWASAAAALAPQASMRPAASSLSDLSEPPKLTRPGKKSEVDTTSGATPGVARACRELGMASVVEVSQQRGIKAPGEV